MKHSPRILAVLLAALLALPLLGLGACQSGGATGELKSDGFPSPSKDFVFDVAADVLQKQGFSPSREGSSRQTWTIVTHWDTSLQPFSGQGYRQRATVKVLDVPNRPGWYYTETQVVRQPNDNMLDPSNAMVAKWGTETRVADLEGVINHRIELNFLPGEVSPKFRERYGMPDEDAMRIPSSPSPTPAAPSGPIPR